MGRSVNYLNSSTEILYLPFETEDEFTSKEDWQWFKDDISDRLIELAPSLAKSKRWEGNEVRIILENNLVEVGLSEYCGLASISIRPHQLYWTKEGLARKWISQIWPKVQKEFETQRLERAGIFSNGESVYTKPHKEI